MHLFVCVCLGVCMCTECVQVVFESRSGSWIPGTGGTSGCDPRSVGAGK